MKTETNDTTERNETERNGISNNNIYINRSVPLEEVRRRGAARRVAQFKAEYRRCGQAAFFDPQTAPHVIALALTDDWKSLRRWRQLERALPDGAMREELAAFHAEIAAGESVRNRGAALNARLGRIAGL